MPEHFYEEFGRRLRRARRNASRRMTQAKLAEEVGLSRSSIANIERGVQRVPLHLLVNLADALRVPPGDLLPSTVATGPRKIAANTMREQGFPEDVIRKAVAHVDKVED